MPELVLDVPQIHKLAFTHVIKPLIDKGWIQPKFIHWTESKKDKPKEEEEDDIVFDSSDCFFQLMALMLVDYKSKENHSWKDTVEWYTTTMKWKAVA